ncbi:MAG TPA: hypothetical protein VFS43_11815 [Polyangiaceae bacterium]|nr:hypothetical protein [Polyangiaceae bacterium]
MIKRIVRESSNPTPDESFTLARGATLWSIERRGTRVTRLGGPASGRARVTLRRCASVPRARELMARAVAAKLEAGFRPVARPAGWPARRRPTVASSAAHERALRRARDAASALVAYGEWLRAQGDPRGALVAADAAAVEAGGVVASGCPACDANAAWFRRPSRRAPPDRPPWWPAAETLLALDPAGPRAGRHRELLERHGRHVLGRAAPGDEALRFGWRLGFIEVVHLEHSGDEADAAALRAALRRALRLPASRFARVVDVATPADSPDEPSFTDEAFVRDSLAGRAFPSVVSLSLGAWLEDDDDEPDFAPPEGWRREAAPLLGELRAVSRAFPRLAHLSAAGRGIDLGGVDLGHLRHAAFEFARPDEGALDVVAGAEWRRLRSLRLSIGDLARPEHASDVAARVAALADSGRAPELRHLRLERVPLTDELCDALGRSALAGSLVSLEIVRGEMTAEGAEALLRHRHRLPRLRALDVARNALPDDAIAALAAGFGRGVELLAGEQRDVYEHDDASDSEFVREKALLARGGRPDPLGGPAPDDDGGDDIEGLLDAAVVLTSLRGGDGVDGADTADGEPDGELDGEADGRPLAAADGAEREDDDELADPWPMAALDYDGPPGDDEDDEGAGPLRAGRSRRRDRRLAVPQRVPADGDL